MNLYWYTPTNYQSTDSPFQAGLTSSRIEGLGAITRYVGNFEFWENGVKDSILQTSVSKPFDDISTSGLKHHVR